MGPFPPTRQTCTQAVKSRDLIPKALEWPPWGHSGSQTSHTAWGEGHRKKQHSEGKGNAVCGPQPPKMGLQIPHPYLAKEQMPEPTQKNRQVGSPPGQMARHAPGPPAHTPGTVPASLRANSPASLPSAAGPLSPDPGYKYLPLHPGGICLTQATMETAFLPPRGSHTTLWARPGC